jgi:hypothetical protein
MWSGSSPSGLTLVVAGCSSSRNRRNRLGGLVRPTRCGWFSLNEILDMGFRSRSLGLALVSAAARDRCPMGLADTVGRVNSFPKAYCASIFFIFAPWWSRNTNQPPRTNNSRQSADLGAGSWLFPTTRNMGGNTNSHSLERFPPLFLKTIWKYYVLLAISFHIHIRLDRRSQRAGRFGTAFDRVDGGPS